MGNFEIRRAAARDVGQLQQISRQTFLETFASGNTAENMDSYLEKEFECEKLASELKDTNSEFYFSRVG